MTGPDTNHGEIGRAEAKKIAEATLAAANNELEFRLTMLNGQNRLELMLQSLTEKVGLHEREDERRFNSLESRLGGVSSSVGRGEREFSKYDGIKIGIGFAATFFLAVGTAVWAVFTFFVSNKP